MVNQIVLPGETIPELKSYKGVTILGPGLRRSEDSNNSVIATRGGTLRHKPNNVYWVEAAQKRYVPKKGDLVVGVIVKKGGDNFKVDIGAGELASLSIFVFEGATKKQKPDLQLGDAIYAKLLTAHREMEPELVCIDKYYKAANLGVLSNDGFIMTVSMDLIQQLLNVEFPLLGTLGKKLVYEIAIGLNGRVWINSKSLGDTLKVMNALVACERQSSKEISDLCRRN